MRTYIVVPDPGVGIPASLMGGQKAQDRFDAASIEIKGDIESGGSLTMSNYVMSFDGASIASSVNRSRAGSSGMFMRGISAFLRHPFTERARGGDLPIKYAEMYNAMELGIEDESFAMSSQAGEGSMGRTSNAKRREAAKGQKSGGDKHAAGGKSRSKWGLSRSDAKSSSVAGPKNLPKNSEKTMDRGTGRMRDGQESAKGVRSWSPESLAGITQSISLLGPPQLGGGGGNEFGSHGSIGNGSASRKREQLIKASDAEWEYAAATDSKPKEDSREFMEGQNEEPPTLSERSSFKLGSGLRLQEMIIEDGENDAGSDQDEGASDTASFRQKTSAEKARRGSWSLIADHHGSNIEANEGGGSQSGRSSGGRRDSADQDAETVMGILLGI